MPSKTKPRPSSTSRPWISLTASWHWMPAMTEAVVETVGTLPSSMSSRVKQGAASPGLEHLPIDFVHRTLVARAAGRIEDPGHALEPLDRAVDPDLARPGGGAIDRHAGLAIVEAAEDHVGPAIGPGAQVVDDVGRQRLHAHAGVDFAGPGGGDVGLRQPAVLAAKRDGAGKVRVLDAVAIGHQDVADAQEGQVLEDLVPQRPGADDQEFRLRTTAAGPTN